MMTFPILLTTDEDRLERARTRLALLSQATITLTANGLGWEVSVRHAENAWSWTRWQNGGQPPFFGERAVLRVFAEVARWLVDSDFAPPESVAGLRALAAEWSPS